MISLSRGVWGLRVCRLRYGRVVFGSASPASSVKSLPDLLLSCHLRLSALDNPPLRAALESNDWPPESDDRLGNVMGFMLEGNGIEDMFLEPSGAMLGFMLGIALGRPMEEISGQKNGSIGKPPPGAGI